MWYRQQNIEFTDDKGRIRLWAVLESEEHDGPAFNGSVPNARSSSIYAGDITYVRSGVDGVGFVRVTQPPIKGVRTHQHALRASAEDALEVANLQVVNQEILHQLDRWTDLTDEEIEEINTSIRSTATVLRGSRDRNRRMAEAWATSSLGVRQATGTRQLNPGATMAKISAENAALGRRGRRIIKTQSGIVGRAQWADRIDLRLTLEASRFWLFLDAHETVQKGDVDALLEAGWDTLKPINQLFRWLMREVEARGGVIQNPDVLEAARSAYDFHHLIGSMLRVITPIANLTLADAAGSSEHQQAQWLSRLEHLIGLLENLAVGVAYRQLAWQLRDLVVRIAVNVKTQNWLQARQLAKQFEQLLIYRDTKHDPLPSQWYGYEPPESEAWAVADRRNREENHRLYQQVEAMQPDDILDGVPKGPRG